MDIFKELLIDLTKKRDVGLLSPEEFKKIQRNLVVQKAKMRGKSDEEYIGWIESIRQKYIDEEVPATSVKEKPLITSPSEEVKETIPITPVKEKPRFTSPSEEVKEIIPISEEKENLPNFVPINESTETTLLTPNNSEEPDSSKKPVIQSETLDDGNCFYSSVYRALREAKLLEKVKRCYSSLNIRGTDISCSQREQEINYCLKVAKPLLSTEYDFIQSWRNVVAGEVERGRVIGNVYDLLLSVVKDKATYKSILEAQPDWFRKLYSRGLPTKSDFFKKTAEKIRIMGSWAAELEVTITKELLNLCNIEFVAHNSNIAEASKYTEDGKPIIHLWNQGEAHWIRFSFDEVTPEYIESEEYKELKESLCEEECKAIEIRLESAQKAIEGSEKAIQNSEKEIILHTERLQENRAKVESLVEELEICKKKCEGVLKGGTRKVKKNRKKSKRVSRKKL